MNSSNDTSKAKTLWFAYGAEILTVFFALAVLTGRVYAQSYWSVFGLSPELFNTALIDYAIMSPNAALASILMAIGTVAFVIFFRRPFPNIIGEYNSRVVSIIGIIAFFIGSYATLIMRINSSTWTIGVAGIIFGLGYLMAIGGMVAWVQAALKEQDKKISRLDEVLFGWVRKVPFILVYVFFIVGLISVSLWGILDTAQMFGANEAKFMYDARPIVTLQLDSPKGFEDLASILNPDGTASMRVRIIAETGGFLYISPGFERDTGQLNVRAVPVSRVQAIQYSVEVNPLGE